MKTHWIYFSIFFLVILGSSCSNNDNNCVNGSGQIIDEERPVADFSDVLANISGNVLVTQGPTTKVTVRTHSNVLPLVRTQVNDSLLTISTDGCIGQIAQLEILITMPDVNSLLLAGSGNITTQTLETENLDLILNGSGNIETQGTFGELLMTIAGSGNFVASGSTDLLGATVNGSGNISSFNLQARKAAVLVTGSGLSELSVTDTLTVNISGSGSVRYKGDPHLDVNISGSGTVDKVN